MNFLVEMQNFVFKCARVWKITRKPTKEEFKTIARASSLGLLFIGLIGFLIATIMNLFSFK